MELKTFYCDACAHERRWPIQFKRTHGFCQICGVECEGNHVFNNILPSPPVIQQKLQLEFNFE